METKKTVFHFHGDLSRLLHGRWKGSNSITISLGRRTSIKDVVESFGLPHTEIGSLVLNREEVTFNLVVKEGSIFDVYPISVPWTVTKPTILRPVSLPSISFVVDVNVGRLARYLRAAGLDTLYNPIWNDEFIANMMQKEQRILLTRDMQLLKRKQVMYGRYVRETNPQKQLYEILDMFDLSGKIAPFTRCLDCNNPLKIVDKEDVIHLLEPLTRRYYTSFSKCTRCEKIYWPGSHIENMGRLFQSYSDS